MEGNLEQANTSDGGGVLGYAPSFITAAHELKSPLALVRQLALGIESGDMAPGEIAETARKITLASERALRLTTNITKTAKLQDGLFELEPLNPLSLCQEVVSEITPLYTAQGRKLTLYARRRALLGLANRDLLRRILMNFLDNALHYSVSDAPVSVTATAVDGGSKIRLGVRDFGPGLMTAKGAYVQHNRPESSGLGIYIARQFAASMNADIGTIRHRDGATFYVDISASTQMRLL